MDVQRPDARKKRDRRLVWAGVAAIAFASLFVAAWRLADRPPAIARDEIWSAEVSRGQFIHEISASGTLVATELRAVTNRSEGVVEAIRVLPGQVVGPDDVLLEMSSPTLEDELADAKWELAAAEADQRLSRMESENRYLDIVAQLASAESEYTSSKLELEANEDLDDEQLTSEIDIQRLRLKTQQLQKRMEAEQARLDGYEEYRSAQEASTVANVSKLQEKVARLESRVDDLFVRAGTHGVVQEVNAEEGEQLQAGKAVAKVVNPSRLIARIGVSERDAAMVEIGMPVRLEFGREATAGKVSRIDPTVRDRLVTVDVMLTEDGREGLRPDLSVIARIELQRVDDALIVDRPVGVRDGFETVDLFRLDGDRAHRVSVELGRVSARQVEILSGLDVGDDVILADLSDWIDEPELRIR
jgi:HlyD family secretion protein